MRHPRMKLVVLLIILLSLVVGCGTSNTGPSKTPCEKQSGTVGNIITITPAPSSAPSDYVGGLLVDASKEKAKSDKLYVHVHKSTQIFEKQGQACRSVPFATLRVGQRIQIQSTGTAQQTYPPQIAAVEIVIMP